jgi:hypothetical protein
MIVCYRLTGCFQDLTSVIRCLESLSFYHRHNSSQHQLSITCQFHTILNKLIKQCCCCCCCCCLLFLCNYYSYYCFKNMNYNNSNNNENNNRIHNTKYDNIHNNIKKEQGFWAHFVGKLGRQIQGWTCKMFFTHIIVWWKQKETWKALKESHKCS